MAYSRLVDLAPEPGDAGAAGMGEAGQAAGEEVERGDGRGGGEATEGGGRLGVPLLGDYRRRPLPRRPLPRRPLPRRPLK